VVYGIKGAGYEKGKASRRKVELEGKKKRGVK